MFFFSLSFKHEQLNISNKHGFIDTIITKTLLISGQSSCASIYNALINNGQCRT